MSNSLKCCLGELLTNVKIRHNSLVWHQKRRKEIHPCHVLNHDKGMGTTIVGSIHIIYACSIYYSSPFDNRKNNKKTKIRVSKDHLNASIFTTTENVTSNYAIHMTCEYNT